MADQWEKYRVINTPFAFVTASRFPGMPDNDNEPRLDYTEACVKMKRCGRSGSTRRTLLPALSSHRFTLLQLDGRKRISDPR